MSLEDVVVFFDAGDVLLIDGVDSIIRVSKILCVSGMASIEIMRPTTCAYA